MSFIRPPRLSLAGLALLATAALLASGPRPAAACSAPVFRYALENWPPDSYEAVVFHRGPLTAEQQRLVADLGEEGRAGRSKANLAVRVVDLNGEPAADDVALFDRQAPSPERSETSLPWLLVRYPPAKRARNVADVWAGPLTSENVERLIDSPLRREIARRLLDGHNVVWVFLDAGDAARDDAKFALIETELKRLENTLTLPEIDPADIASGEISVAAATLKPRFSAVRIRPESEAGAEKLFAAMLRNSEEDGTPESLSAFAGEPLAFPIFGRGRALFAYVGEGINANMIQDGCGQLIEKCLCTRKADFAGTDLVMAVDWAALVEVAETAERELPPLSGPAALLAAPASGGREPLGQVPGTTADSSKSSEKTEPVEQAAADSHDEAFTAGTRTLAASEALGSSTTPTPATSSHAEVEMGYSISLFGLLGVLFIGLILVVVIGSAFTGRKEGTG
ncbi:MAG: hypothetical protein WD066_18515 [Planctomycetaceae bacterium]